MGITRRVLGVRQHLRYLQASLMYFYFSRASALRNSAAEIRPSYNKGQQEALDEFVGNFFYHGFRHSGVALSCSPGHFTSKSIVRYNSTDIRPSAPSDQHHPFQDPGWGPFPTGGSGPRQGPCTKHAERRAKPKHVAA